MTKFNLKEHIAKNKATFFGSLTEGQFSWMTQDTGQQIGSQDENKISVYMFDNKGKYWFERDYDGYGVFGGMDYYELLDQMNGGKGDRGRGIDLAFDKSKEGETLFPALVVSPSNFNYKTHDFTKEAEHDPNQSWYEPEEDDFYDQNDEEEYGYNDEEEELEEGYQGQFYAPEYIEKKYGKEMAKQIEDEIYDMDENSWDRFTGMESAKEVDEYIADIVSMLNEGYDEFKRADKGSKNVTAKNKGEEEVYGAGVKKGEKIEKKKMKVSEFKAKIREMVLAEANAPINMVTTMDGKTVVGTHQYGVGFKSNEAGKKMGFKDNPTSIPNGTKMSLSKKDMNEDTYAPTPETDFLAELEGMLDDKNGLTDLQQYVYDFESKVSDERDEEEEQKFLDDIKQLVTPQDVYDYYSINRGWSGSDLDNIFKQVKTKFKNLITTDDLTPLQRRAYSYTKERFGDEEAKNSLDQIKTLKTGQEFTNWVNQKLKSLSEAKDKEVEDEVDIDIESPEAMDAPMSGINVTQNADADLTGTEKEVQDNLEAAMEAAKKLGDEKLSSQIGNTLTFFTRQHVVKENLKETLLLQKRAGIITETQYKQKLKEANMTAFSSYSDNFNSSNSSNSPKASFEDQWNNIPTANKEILKKSTGKEPIEIMASSKGVNFVITKGSDKKFYRYEYTQAEKPGEPAGPFITIEDAKKLK